MSNHLVQLHRQDRVEKMIILNPQPIHFSPEADFHLRSGTTQNKLSTVIISILQIWKLRCREVKGLVQDHTANK